MPRGCRQKGPANWNTLFNYELECQRVKRSPSRSSNTCFVLFISVTLGRAEDDDLGKFKLFSFVQEVHSRMRQVIQTLLGKHVSTTRSHRLSPPDGAFTLTVRIFTFSILIHKADETKQWFPKQSEKDFCILHLIALINVNIE